MRAALFWISGICGLIAVGGLAAAGESTPLRPPPVVEYLPPPINYLTNVQPTPTPAPPLAVTPRDFPVQTANPAQEPQTKRYILYLPSPAVQPAAPAASTDSAALRAPVVPVVPVSPQTSTTPTAGSRTATASLSMPPPPSEAAPAAPPTPASTLPSAPLLAPQPIRPPALSPAFPPTAAPESPVDAPPPGPPPAVTSVTPPTPTPAPLPTPSAVPPPSPGTTTAAAPEVQSAPPTDAPSPTEAHPADSPLRWLVKPVRFNLAKYPLAQFLREFAASQGVTSNVSQQITGTISGNFSFENPAHMLRLVCQAQHLGWYFDGTVVYFYKEPEMESRFFVLDGKSEETLKSSLRELGLFDPRFPWRLADNGRLLMVQGPPVYLSRINEALTFQTEANARQAKGRKLGVFRLKYASAADRLVDVGQGQTTVPGVAELLRRIINDQAGAPYALPSPFDSPGTPQLTPLALPETGRYNNREAANDPGATANNQNNSQQPAGPSSSGEGKKKDPAASEAPVIEADSRLNAVLIWDSEEKLPQYENIIERLDQPLALVEIRAAILDVQADRVNELGINWSVSRTGNPQWGAGQNVPVVGDPASLAGDGLHMATLYKYGLTQFMARVTAMEKDGNANVLSRPTVLTQDNVQAILEHTETFYVKLEGERQVNLANIKTGMILKVTPHVVMTERGQAVQLIIFISDGADNTNSTQTTALPRVKQSTITTQAMVHEGESLIIGGYYNEIRNITDTGVPVIKNIPGLGALFRSRSRNNTKNERLFVLSPRVLEPGLSPIVPGTEGERVFEQSPAKDSLDKPAYDDKTPTPPRRFFWNRRSASDAAARQEEEARK